jgi:hypothetical protein
MRKHSEPLDDLFRSRLEDYEVAPPPETREALIRKFSAETGERASSRRGFIILSMVLLLLTGAIVGILLFRTNKEINSIHPGQKEINAGKISSGEKKHTEKITSLNNTRASGSKKLIANVPAQKPPADVAMNTVSEKEHALPPATTDSPLRSGTSIDFLVTENGYPLLDRGEQSPVMLDTVSKLTQTQITEIISRYKSNPPKSWNLSVGAYYTPELMFNTLNGEKFANNTGVEGTFRFGRYSVRTGAGVSITSGYNEILVKTNPYLGTYQILDSVVFRWDEQHYNLIPYYFTTGTAIYDTAFHYTYYNFKKRYTYLQVPLVLGYDFWNNDRFTIGIRGGAVMSVLLKTKAITEEYDPGKDKVVTINYITPDRISLNWQALGGINVSYRLSKKFSLELEPEVRYYFNSVYEKSEITTKPWSVGLRAAFLFNIFK